MNLKNSAESTDVGAEIILAKYGSKPEACKWTEEYDWDNASAGCLVEFGNGWIEIERKMDTSGKYGAPPHLEYCCREKISTLQDIKWCANSDGTFSPGTPSQEEGKNVVLGYKEDGSITLVAKEDAMAIIWKGTIY